MLPNREFRFRIEQTLKDGVYITRLYLLRIRDASRHHPRSRAIRSVQTVYPEWPTNHSTGLTAHALTARGWAQLGSGRSGRSAGARGYGWETGSRVEETSQRLTAAVSPGPRGIVGRSAYIHGVRQLIERYLRR